MHRRPAPSGAGRNGPSLGDEVSRALSPRRLAQPRERSTARTPAGVVGVARRGVRLRLAPQVELPAGGDLVGGRPHALGEAGQVGGAQRGGLLDHRPCHGHLELVGLELQQQVHGRGAAVDPQLGDRVARRPRSWPRRRRGSGRPSPRRTARARWAAVVPRVMPTIVPRAYGSHHGLPRPVKAGTRKTPPVSGHDSASGPIAGASGMTPSPSRSHCTAAPVTKIAPSRA